MAQVIEIPSDGEVCATLTRIGSSTARELVDALVNAGHNARDSQWAIQRCLDRGKITIGAGLKLTAVALGRRAA